MSKFQHLICPKCKKQLNKVGNSLKCDNGHSYDIASEGYVNLLPPQRKGEIPGDSKEMIKARHDFLSKDYYKPLCDKLCSIISEYSPSIIVDIGCGEGYYTSRMNITGSYVIGIDISKFALASASKSDKASDYCVSSLHSLPLQDSIADMVVCCFCAHDAKEFSRILKKNAKFILVGPGKRHLFGLKSILYQNPYENPENEEALEGFGLVATETVSYNIDITGKDNIWNLFSMTPYFWKTSKDAAEKLKTISTLNTDIEFNISTYAKL